MTTLPNLPAPSTLTSPQSDAREVSPGADASRASAPSNDGNAGATQADRLSGDAPVMALIAKLHAGTTLAERVRRMRGRREGQRLRRMKVKQTEPPKGKTLCEVFLAEEQRQPTTQHNDDNDNETARLNKPA